MTRAWWIYVAAFLFGVTMIVLGIVKGNTAMIALGFIIGVVLFFARRYVQQ